MTLDSPTGCGGVPAKNAAEGSAAPRGAGILLPCPGPGFAPGTGDLLSFLPYGRAHATSVPALCRATGWSDREVRAELERLVVEAHIPVVTLPTTRGVFVAVTPEEVDLATANLRARSLSMLRRCRALRLCREALAWSPELFPEV
ncbi:MAG: hypothetical protein M1274_15460 [Actinobacteria bacterium]|nr:hypothetical protein [Actinomycetota bacterium]